MSGKLYRGLASQVGVSGLVDLIAQGLDLFVQRLQLGAGHPGTGDQVVAETVTAFEQGLARSDNAEEQAFYRGKLQAARYYVTWELPEIYGQTTVLRRLDTTTLDMQESWF